ncbi:MAG: hypothetical protein SwBeaMacB_13870 [Shewanella algae]
MCVISYPYNQFNIIYIVRICMCERALVPILPLIGIETSDNKDSSKNLSNYPGYQMQFRVPSR